MIDLAQRTEHRIDPDPRRVIVQLFVPGEEQPGSRSRAAGVLARILALSDGDVAELSRQVLDGFRGRHRDLMRAFSENFAVVDADRVGGRRMSAERRMLIGAFFTKEYTPEAGGIFNPSMVALPEQPAQPADEVRFLLAVRCVGEGNLSSIGFRTGIVGPGSSLRIDEAAPTLETGTHRRAAFGQRDVFLARLADLGTEDARAFLMPLPETFTIEQLSERLDAIHEHTLHRQRGQHAIEAVSAVATSSYDVEFPPETAVSERLLWPHAVVESHGMEDARLVRFVEDDGEVTYYATYTAYDGATVTPQLFATKDFRQFHVSPVTGRAAQNKGLALFPRRVNGQFAALSRHDRETTSIAFSDDPRIWPHSEPLHAPRRGWEAVQVGNCGPPIETDAGWLVLTHGVGPMRIYSIGAMLLDAADPSIVLASLPRPLLRPSAGERDGSVPNVVYSCGALLHEGVVTIPYGISDHSIGFAQVYLSELLGHMDSATPRQPW